MVKKQETNEIQKFFEDYNIDPILFIIAVLITIAVILVPMFFVKSSDATIEGHTIDINARVSGQISQSYVTKDQEVKKGDVLFEIDPQEYQIELMKAQSDLAICKAKLKILTNQPYSVSDLQANILIDTPAPKQPSRYKAGENNYSQYSKVYDSDELKPKTISQKQAELLANNASKKSFQDIAKSKTSKIKETTIQQLGDLLSNPSKIDVSKDTVDSINDQIEVLQSQIDELELKLSYTRVCSPKDGIISSISAEQGYYVQTKEPLCTIIPKQVWVTANFSKKDIAKIQVGQFVNIKIPNYRSRLFKGVVASIDTVEVAPNQQEEIEVTKDNLELEQPQAKKVTNVKIDFVEDYSDFNLLPGVKVLAIVKVK